MKTNLEDIRDDILNGHYDGRFGQITGYMKARNKAVRDAKINDIKADLQVGFKMRTKGLRNEAHNGLVVTIHEIKQTKVIVTYDDPKATKFKGGRVEMPISALTWLRE